MLVFVAVRPGATVRSEPLPEVDHPVLVLVGQVAGAGLTSQTHAPSVHLSRSIVQPEAEGP